MNTVNRRKLFLYSSLFIALALNMPKLLALRKNGMIARVWHFDLGELSFQFVMTFVFCVAIFYYNKDRGPRFLEKWRTRRQGSYAAVNLLILLLFSSTASLIQHIFFQQDPYVLGGYGLRFSFCMLLIAIELRVYYLMEDAREKEIENEHLRNAYLKSELALLKGQLNPHFFFNALSSLSAVVREDPRKAQQYISHLSKVFRYSLQSSDTNLVSLKEEFQAVRSYAELMKMRYEGGFELSMPADEGGLSNKIPPMSLQLLLENALKHNRASTKEPLQVAISFQPDCIEVRNNLQLNRHPEPGAGIGLANLNERYRILLHQEISIIKTASDFIVKLPLL